MNRNTVSGKIETKVNTAATIAGSITGYGKAIVIDSRGPRETVRRSSPAELFRFYYGECLAGILFISAFLIYTILAPDKAANPLRCVSAMIDRFLKKVLDVSGAIIGLVAALPLFLIIPILIKLTSRGPVFYSQDRVGVNRRRRSRRVYKGDIQKDKRTRERRRIDNLGRPFKVIKFRTMVHDAEKSSGPVWATRNDSRVTGLGRFLRKTRIDEIPQLINVLKGDMSLVGPRPERAVFAKDLATKVPNYNVRLNVRPGITGLAQVNRGYDSTIESVVGKVEHDVKYIRDWSILSDLKILARTVLVVLTGKGAF